MFRSRRSNSFLAAVAIRFSPNVFYVHVALTRTQAGNGGITFAHLANLVTPGGWRNAILAPLCRRFPRRLSRVCAAYLALRFVATGYARDTTRGGAGARSAIVYGTRRTSDRKLDASFDSFYNCAFMYSVKGIYDMCTSRYHCPLIKRHIDVSFDATFDGTTSSSYFAEYLDY